MAQKFLTGLKGNQSAILFSASILGIGLGLISSIVNTRFLNPEEYGNYRYVYSIISFIASLLLFGYFVSGSRLLALSKTSRIRRKINGALIIILLIATGITISLMIPLYFIHKYWINPDVASLFLWSIPIVGTPLFLSFINTTFQGENRINELSLARLLPYVVYVPVGYLVYSHFGSSAVILMLLQNGIAIIIYILLILRNHPIFTNLNKVFNQLRKENKTYGRHVYIGSVLAVSFAYVSAITLGIFEKNNINVGYYSLALTMSMPLTMLPGIVGTTHFKEFAFHDKIKASIIKKTVILTLISLIAFIIMIVPLVKWIYTEDYYVVGYYASFLALGFAFHGFGDMFNRFLGAHGCGKQIRNSATLTGISQITGSFILVYFLGIYGAILTRILSSMIYFIMMVYYYKKTKIFL